MSKTVAKALSILRQFGTTDNELGVTEIARSLGLDKVVVHRLLRALAAERFVVQDEQTRRYRLGGGLIELARRHLREQPLAEVARPWVEQLAATSSETVLLAVGRGTQVVVALPALSKHVLAVSASIGDSESMHCTSVGKVLMAFGPTTLLAQVIATGLTRKTERTITTATRLRAAVEQTRQNGWSLDDEELVAGVRAIAAPVFGPDGHALGGVAIRAPSARLTDARIRKLLPSLRAACRAVTAAMGGVEPDRRAP